MIAIESNFGRKLQDLGQGLQGPLWDVADDLYSRRVYGRDLWPRNLIQDREVDEPREPVATAIVWPHSLQGIVKLVECANAQDWELYPYGAGSGVCGGLTPTHVVKRPRIVVDLKYLDQIESIDDVSLTARVQAGILGQTLEEDLNARGYTMGHFPSSIYCSSFGGYLATRAAGQLSTYYGKMEDMVLAVQGVLPTGQVFETTAAPKTSVGPDWNHMFVGSEGVLAFLTAATVKIHRLPEHRRFLSWQVASTEEALNGIRLWMQSGYRPAVIRLYDEDESRILHGLKGDRVRLVVMVEGEAALTDFTTDRMMALAASRTGWFDTGTEPGEEWWAHRYDVSYRQQQIMSHRRMILDTFEVAGPWSQLPRLHKNVKSVVEKFSGKNGMLVVIAHFSHFYHSGANIYFTLCGRSPEELPTQEFYDKVWDALLEACLEVGGAISHHHGIGRLKVRANTRQRGVLLNVLKGLKHGVDPKNILNPGNLGL